MKTILIILVALLVWVPAYAKGRSAGSRSRSGTVTVRSHKTKSGKRVETHRRTKGNRTQTDNWSTKGNVNPDTGRAGTRTPRK